jgi:nucleoside-diphosphate-sugar epimerase
MKITVVGADGFIGRHLLGDLARRGYSCLPITRKNGSRLFEDELGHVIYCAGVTSDFQERPGDVVMAHVSLLQEVLLRSRLDSLLYLSSTRLYLDAAGTAETREIPVRSTDRNYLYNLSKLLGENICQFARVPTRIVRLSNVYGPDPEGPTFLSEVIRMAIAGRIRLLSTPESQKDYVSIDDVVSIIPQIALGGKEILYNVASGRNVTHRAIVQELQAHTRCVVEFSQGAETVAFPPIDVSRLKHEFSWQPRELLADLPQLLADYRSLL